MTTRLLVLPALLAFALPTAPAHAGGGCFEEGPATPVAATTVVIAETCFGPLAARVPAGARVTWRNQSGLAHNVSGPGIQFGDLPAGGTYTATFREPGLYPYACMLHAGMSGVVVVGAAEPAARPTANGGGAGLTGWAVGAAVTLAAAGVVLVTRVRPAPAG